MVLWLILLCIEASMQKGGSLKKVSFVLECDRRNSRYFRKFQRLISKCVGFFFFNRKCYFWDLVGFVLIFLRVQARNVQHSVSGSSDTRFSF